MRKTHIRYVTSSPFKVDEIRIIQEKCTLPDGEAVGDRFHFEIRDNSILEALEISLASMVRMEVASAYSQIKVPCIVEHAGLVFHDLSSQDYPGGLTKPMWNALGDRFVSETSSAGRRAIARAAVGYCDGMNIHTFVGETLGHIAPAPRGSRHFYWDTVFVPDNCDGSSGDMTYAEIVDTNGLEHKVIKFSQSTKAILRFLEFLSRSEPAKLWRS